MAAMGLAAQIYQGTFIYSPIVALSLIGGGIIILGVEFSSQNPCVPAEMLFSA
jgi:hypothetical protein